MQLEHSKVLIVDDQTANIRLLEIMLEQAGYTECWGTSDPLQALPMFESCKPDVLLLDLQMPKLDGFAIMRAIAERFPGSNVPILVLTADATLPTKHRALNAGARDFLCKPFDEIEVLLRIRNLLQLRFHALHLETMVRQRTDDLNQARIEVLDRLALAAEHRDPETSCHTRRVATITARIAEKLGFCPDEIEDLYRAAPLHDLGKIGIDDSVLLKPGRLTEEEFAMMKRHVEIGGDILSGGASRLMRLAEEIARYHHERWDGTGYLGLAGEAIPISARIVSVADVFDALTHARPYKDAWSVSDAVAEIQAMSGKHLDPRVVAAFLTLSHETLI